jgi:hypothetical protein
MDVSTNPLTILAADVAAGPVLVWTGNVHVLQVEFQGYAAGTDTATIQNFAGKTFCFLHGNTTLETERSGHVGTCMGGIRVPITGITAGAVRIYIK